MAKKKKKNPLQERAETMATLRHAAHSWELIDFHYFREIWVHV